MMGSITTILPKFALRSKRAVYQDEYIYKYQCEKIKRSIEVVRDTLQFRGLKNQKRRRHESVSISVSPAEKRILLKAKKGAW